MSTPARIPAAIVAAALALAPAAAWAHTGGGTGGFAHGFMHPIGGLDHLLAMVAVGLFAAQLGGRALWAVPTTFVLVMALGGASGVASVQLPFVELGIALSVATLGLLVVAGRPWPVGLAMALVGVFAVFHGHAHGAEMPVDASGVAYGLGFLLATSLLHASGIGLRMALAFLSRSPTGRLTQATGMAICVAGVTLLVAAVG